MYSVNLVLVQILFPASSRTSRQLVSNVKLLLSLKRLKLLLLNKQKKLRKFREVVLSILSVLPLLFVT